MLYIMLYVAYAILAILYLKTKKIWFDNGRNIVNVILLALFVVNLLSAIFTTDRVTFGSIFDDILGLVIWGVILVSTQ